MELGLTQGYRRTKEGYSALADVPPKRIFVRPLCRDARAQLTHPERDRFQLKCAFNSCTAGVPKIMLNAERMRLLPQCFKIIPDPLVQELKAHCRSQGRRHRLSNVLSTVLGIAAGATLGARVESTLCGMRGYKAMSNWADALGQQARERFGCLRKDGCYVVPSEFVIRDCLVRIEPGTLDRALNTWNQVWGDQDDALAMDGKTMKNALDKDGFQAHIMSVIGHKSKRCHAQKKVGTLAQE